jgi:hypothetical protein
MHNLFRYMYRLFLCGAMLIAAVGAEIDLLHVEVTLASWHAGNPTRTVS